MGRAILGMMALAAGSAWTMGAAETISGRATAGGAPLANVRVTHLKTGAADTTGADGRFEVKINTVSLAVVPSPAPGFALRGGRLELDNPSAGPVTAALFSMDGRQEAVLYRGVLPAGSHSLALAPGAGVKPGLRMLAVSAGGAVAYAKVLSTGRGLEARDGFRDIASAALRKAQAIDDTLVFATKGYFTQKKGIPVLSTQDLGDVAMARDPLMVNNILQDKWDQQILDALRNRQLEENIGLVLKAMIVIESAFNVQAISMWDVQLPCGTHSYGLIQVTPGCVRGYATLPPGSRVTATVSGGLNGNPAKLAWNDPADQKSGHTTVQEAGIIINLVTNPENPLWSTSAFNPAYSIDHGAGAFKSVMGEMRSRFGNCSAPEYVAMTLAGYNQGSLTVNGCTSYNAGGLSYATKVLNQYRKFCASAGVTPAF